MTPFLFGEFNEAPGTERLAPPFFGDYLFPSFVRDPPISIPIQFPVSASIASVLWDTHGCMVALGNI